MTEAFDTVWCELQQRAEAVMQAKQIPGAALGLHYRGEEATVGLGTTSIVNPLPVDEQTLFQIGSITKTFTTLLLMQCVESGDLDLDAPVRRYLPAFRVLDESTSAEVTPRHLLTHLAGWVGDHFVDTGPGLDAIERYVASMAVLPQLASLGTHWSYNNASFCLAGRLVEILTDRPWHVALRERLLEPLGMSAATEMTDVLTRRYVVGHVRLDGDLQVAQPWPLPRCMRPAGGICADIQDMMRYARYQLGDGATESGERLLQAETTERMRSWQCAIRQPDEEMALGWFRGRVGRDLRWFTVARPWGRWPIWWLCRPVAGPWWSSPTPDTAERSSIPWSRRPWTASWRQSVRPRQRQPRCPPICDRPSWVATIVPWRPSPWAAWASDWWPPSRLTRAFPRPTVRLRPTHRP